MSAPQTLTMLRDPHGFQSESGVANSLTQCAHEVMPKEEMKVPILVVLLGSRVFVMTHRTLQFSVALVALSACQVWMAGQAMAQRNSDSTKGAEAKEQAQWYYGGDEAPKKSIAMQKAELRAEQRMDRLASQRWYGFTPGRPTAATMPFTTMYSPAWTRPGGQPFAWYTGYPQPIINTYYPDRWYY